MRKIYKAQRYLDSWRAMREKLRERDMDSLFAISATRFLLMLDLNINKPRGEHDLTATLAC